MSESNITNVSNPVMTQDSKLIHCWEELYTEHYKEWNQSFSLLGRHEVQYILFLKQGDKLAHLLSKSSEKDLETFRDYLQHNHNLLFFENQISFMCRPCIRPITSTASEWSNQFNTMLTNKSFNTMGDIELIKWFDFIQDARQVGFSTLLSFDHLNDLRQEMKKRNFINGRFREFININDKM